jgi:hypothetical protein
MPSPPAGEVDLRGLAQRYLVAEGQILGYLGEVANGDQRAALAETLALLGILRRLDARAPVVRAYLAEHPEGRPDRVKDLAGSMAIRLDQGAQKAADTARRAFMRVNPDNLDEMSSMPTLAAIDARGTRWSLGRWAEMQTATIGRQATSRGWTMDPPSARVLARGTAMSALAPTMAKLAPTMAKLGNTTRPRPSPRTNRPVRRAASPPARPLTLSRDVSMARAHGNRAARCAVVDPNPTPAHDRCRL